MKFLTKKQYVELLCWLLKASPLLSEINAKKLIDYDEVETWNLYKRQKAAAEEKTRRLRSVLQLEFNLGNVETYFCFSCKNKFQTRRNIKDKKCPFCGTPVPKERE